jgi:hypothetical protein
VASASAPAAPALPKDFRLEVYKQRTVLHCPVANGRRLEVTHQDRAPGATVEPWFDVAVYPPQGTRLFIYATADLCDSRVTRLQPQEPELWVRGACFLLTPDEYAAIRAVFGPLNLTGAK